MGNCTSTTRRFFRLTRRRWVRKEKTTNNTRDEEIEQVTTNESPMKDEKEVEAKIESREDTDTDSESSSSLREFLMLERLCEEYEDLEEIESRIEQENASEKAEQKAMQKKVEDEVESREYEHEYEDSECSSSLREILMLERLCEEYEEAEQRRRERRDQEKLERQFKRFRGDQLSTIEEEEEEEDSSVREIGGEGEHPDDLHREGKEVASGDGDHTQGEKLMSLEEFCGETFAISPTFIEDIIEECRISQSRLEQALEEFEKSLRLFTRYNEMVGKLEKEQKGSAQGDTLYKQKPLRRKGTCKPK
ncbi:unnamed protein product [Rodentolepis nana]|uniref:Uncharacterized protein n=1 Tax=Rodentolepis nana TaxID=102285 RepID=A0A0R3TRA6_RODNA|nr:unnamed protein product [Rodentolepis nana]